MDISITNGGDNSSVWRSPSSMSTSSRNEMSMRTNESRNNSSGSNDQQQISTGLSIGSAKIAKPLPLQRLEAALDLTLLMRQVQSYIGPNVKLPMPSDHNKPSFATSMATKSLDTDQPLKPSLKSIKAKSYNISKVKKSKRWIKNVILDGQLSSDDEDEEALFKSMTASGLSRSSLTKEGKRKKKKEDDMVNDMIKFNNFNRKFKKELEEKKLAAADGTNDGRPIIPKKYERYSYGVMNNSYVDQPLNPIKKEKKVAIKEEAAAIVPIANIDEIIANVAADSGSVADCVDTLIDPSQIKVEKFDPFIPIDIFNVTTKPSVTAMPSVPITTTAALLDDIPYDAFLPDEILESESIESIDQQVLSQGSMVSTWDMMASVKVECKPSDIDSIPSSPSTSIQAFKNQAEIGTAIGQCSAKKKKKSGKSFDDTFDTSSSVLDNLSPGGRINEFDDEDSSNHSGSQNSSLVSQTMSQPPLRSLSMVTGPGVRAVSATVSRPSSRLSSSQPELTTPFQSLTAPPTPTGLTTGLILGMKRPPSRGKSEGGSPKKNKKPRIEVMMERRKQLWSIITKRDVPRAWSQMKNLQEKFLANRKMLSDIFSSGTILLHPPKSFAAKEIVEAKETASAKEEKEQNVEDDANVQVEPSFTGEMVKNVASASSGLVEENVTEAAQPKLTADIVTQENDGQKSPTEIAEVVAVNVSKLLPTVAETVDQPTPDKDLKNGGEAENIELSVAECINDMLCKIEEQD